ncbi:MAG: DNA mismatch repair protein MutS [Nitrospirae bacterium]|nr:DNA mismatch repair protein MutS [Nitrospirota bacterium]
MQEQRNGEFQNSPFKVLKDAIGKTSPRSAAAQKASSHDDHEDDEGLFLRSMSGATRIAADGDQEPGPQTPTAAAEKRVDDEAHGRALFLQAVGMIGTPVRRDGIPGPDEEAPARSSSGRMRQLKRGTIRISEELDLHGFLKDDALRRLEYFTASAYARGLQAVLVITGKGHNSPDGPVLPGAVAAWLREQGKDMVAEIHAAPRDKGGSGAIVVFLKKR